jgi:IS5 family transposase
MQQSTFAAVTFEQYRKPTRRERFLDEMNRVVPWAELTATIEPVSPKAEGPGRPPVGVDRMLRLPCLQQWFNLSDPAVDEALYDSRAMRQFVGIDLGREPVPDEPTICKFRHLLEAHQLGEQLFARIGEYLAKQGVQVNRGTIVDATIISAPSSTKNRTKERDPEMHQTKKGNQWYFGMKAHIGVDSRTKLIHSVAATAANVHDSQVLPELLHGQETRGGRCGVQRATRRDPAARARGQELHPDQSPSPSAPERGRPRPHSHEVESPRERRTCVLGDQADLRMVQSAVPRAGEEYPLALHQLRLGESVRGSAAPAGGSLAGGYAHGGAGSLTAGKPQERRSRTSGFPGDCQD